MEKKMIQQDKHHVVIIGGGFGGLYTAKALKHENIKVTVIDKRNFHLFQPLLYQVATGGLSPGDIASPLRGILSAHKNTTVHKAEVIDIDAEAQEVILRDGQLHYDTLVVATGVSHHYFGNEHWAEFAPGLKTVEDALEMRRRIFLAFEAAERETDPDRRRAWMRFVIVGGGPTGVELAGALAELAHTTLKEDFRSINPAEVEILLLEGVDRVLPPYPVELSAKAQKSLEKLGVTVRTNTLVTDIQVDQVALRHGDEAEIIKTRTVLWAAGMKASPIGQILAERTGIELDRAGRVMVEPDLTVIDHPNIFVIGDLANFMHQDGKPLPGVAPVAMQEGSYVAETLKRRLRGKSSPAFQYFNKGNMAVIGRNAAVAESHGLKISGFPAWLAWVFIHIWYLVEFDNKLMVMFQWAINYFTRKRGSRLITGQNPFPLVGHDPIKGNVSEPQPFSLK
ncbi:MAG: NAD(P)/FAD-dependent oxidoreductase [Anaerolineae bacterium]|nr:NAD(P)/FAD-dependent oxidoreductase [Anaerolineae bacterium]